MADSPFDVTRVSIDATVMGGVPCVRGTRIPVVTLLAALADNLDPARVLVDFPQITREDLSAVVTYAAVALDAAAQDDTAPRWSRMLVSQLLDKLDTEGAVIGLMNPNRTARAFLLKATPDIVRLIEDLTMRADVPRAARQPEVDRDGRT